MDVKYLRYGRRVPILTDAVQFPMYYETARQYPVDLDTDTVASIYDTISEVPVLPELKTVAMKSGGRLGYYEVMPSGDVDDTNTFVRILEAGNDMAPHQLLSALLVSHYFNGRMIVVPYQDYGLTRQERSDVHKANLESVGAKVAAMLETVIPDDSTVHTDGASLGAQIVLPATAKLAQARRVATTVALENPNSRLDGGIIRTAIDFSKAGNDAWEAAERDAEWPALNALFDDPSYVKRSNSEFAKSFLMSTKAVMWLDAMSVFSLGKDLRTLGMALEPGASVVAARDATSAMQSAMGSAQAYLEARQAFKDASLRMVEVASDNRGHAITNNPLARLALTQLALQSVRI